MPDLYTVDTLKVLPVSEAFPGSRLLAPTEGDGSLGRALIDWGDSPINDILIVVFTILTVLYLRRLVGILPYLARGLWRWKEVLNLEASMRLSRDRTSFALVMVVPFCLVISRYNLLPLRILEGMDAGIRTLTLVGIFAVYALLRRFLTRLAEPRRINYDTWRLAATSGYNYFIVLTLVCGVYACNRGHVCHFSPTEDTNSVKCLQSIHGFFVPLRARNPTGRFAGSFGHHFLDWIYACKQDFGFAGCPDEHGSLRSSEREIRR